MLDTSEPAGKIMIPLLPDNESPVLIATLPLTPLVPALTVFNNSAPELVMTPPNPFFPVTPLTDTASTVLEPDTYARDRSPSLPPDD